MPQLSNNQITLHKPIILFFASLLIVSVLGVVSCQNTTNLDQENEEEAPAALQVHIYGMVAPTYLRNTHINAVLVMPNSKPCRESSVVDDHYLGQPNLGQITKSGSYSAFAAVSPMPSCFTVSVVSYDSATSNYIDYDSLLAGPKKIEPADFESHMRLRSPFDSIRVDFTVPDSKK